MSNNIQRLHDIADKIKYFYNQKDISSIKQIIELQTLGNDINMMKTVLIWTHIVKDYEEIKEVRNMLDERFEELLNLERAKKLENN